MDWIKKVIHFSYLDQEYSDVFLWMEADDSGSDLVNIGLLINNFDTSESIQKNLVFDLQELRAFRTEIDRVIGYVEEHLDFSAEKESEPE